MTVGRGDVPVRPVRNQGIFHVVIVRRRAPGAARLDEMEALAIRTLEVSVRAVAGEPYGAVESAAPFATEQLADLWLEAVVEAPELKHIRASSSEIDSFFKLIAGQRIDRVAFRRARVTSGFLWRQHAAACEKLSP